jgi:hypothetical protein
VDAYGLSRKTVAPANRNESTGSYQNFLRHRRSTPSARTHSSGRVSNAHYTLEANPPPSRGARRRRISSRLLNKLAKWWGFHSESCVIRCRRKSWVKWKRELETVLRECKVSGAINTLTRDRDSESQTLMFLKARKKKVAGLGRRIQRILVSGLGGSR